MGRRVLVNYPPASPRVLRGRHKRSPTRNLSDRYVSLKLAFLSPAFVNACLAGEAIELSAKAAITSADAPLLWNGAAIFSEELASSCARRERLIAPCRRQSPYRACPCRRCGRRSCL
jgi:hypothetical protein